MKKALLAPARFEKKACQCFLERSILRSRELDRSILVQKGGVSNKRRNESNSDGAASIELPLFRIDVGGRRGVNRTTNNPCEKCVRPIPSSCPPHGAGGGSGGKQCQHPSRRWFGFQVLTQQHHEERAGQITSDAGSSGMASFQFIANHCGQAMIEEGARLRPAPSGCRRTYRVR